LVHTDAPADVPVNLKVHEQPEQPVFRISEGIRKLDIAFGVLVAIMATLSATSVPMFFGQFIAAITAPKILMSEVYKPLIYIASCHALEALSTQLYVRHIFRLFSIVINNLRSNTFSAILGQDVVSFDNEGASNAHQLVVQDIDSIRQLLSQNVSRDRGIRAMLEMLFGLGFLYKLCPSLALVFTCMIPLTASMAVRVARRIAVVNKQDGAATSRLSRRVMETTGNFKEVFTFSNQQFEKERFSKTESVSADIYMDLGRAKARMESTNRIAIYANIITVFFAGAHLVSRGKLSAVRLISFFSYCFSLNFAMQGILYSYGDINSIASTMHRITSFLQTARKAKEIKSKKNFEATHELYIKADEQLNQSAISDSIPGSHTVGVGMGPTSAPLEVKLQDVAFAYASRPDVAVLRSVNLTVSRGQVTALVSGGYS
jgi:ATP-binding cassette subfamily B (MDR/TAP) protein 8